MNGSIDAQFWRGRRVLLTGHTGFKGAWCALWLAKMGAKVTGFALPPNTNPNLFLGANGAADIDSHYGDIRDAAAVRGIVDRVQPEIVLHMAAQALVRRARREPVETVATNVLGTMHLLDALRNCRGVRVALVVTSDKVYENRESGRPFREDDKLGGREIYGASKAAAEIVTQAMAHAHFADNMTVVATARSGNVIGGGDYAEDRLLPDIVRAVERNEPPLLRYPDARRPWHHVLDCLCGYFIYVQKLSTDPTLPRALNFGPPSSAVLSVAKVADKMLSALGAQAGWRSDSGSHPYEATELVLDTAEARVRLSLTELWPGFNAVAAAAAWYKAVARGASMRAETLAQIDAFMAD
jgi:CDP-glucose 4,6-dehydratase